MKVIEGIVKKLSDADTAIVEVERLVSHRVYGKVMRRTTAFKVDYQGADLKVGDEVKIVETRPISKDKNFKIITTASNAAVAETQKKKRSVPQENFSNSVVAREASKGRKAKVRGK